MQLVVDRSQNRDDLRAFLNPSKMKELSLIEGAVVKIASKARKFILVAVYSKGTDCPMTSIYLNTIYRRQLLCKLGDSVQVEPFPNCQVAESVVFAPVSDTVSSVTGSYSDILMNASYNFKNIPVWKDMVIPVYALHHVFEFRVVSCSPVVAVIIENKEAISCLEKPVERTNNVKYTSISYDDWGGYTQQLRQIRQCIERFNATSILLVAPSGCGKTYLSKIIKNESFAAMEFVESMYLISQPIDKAISFLAHVSQNVEKQKHAIICIDDLDKITSHALFSDTRKDPRLLNTITTFINKFRTANNVILLATSSEPITSIRFEQTISIDLPKYEERIDILKAITRKMTLASPSAIEDLASLTEGKTPSDLYMLVQNTIIGCLPYLLDSFDIASPTFATDDLREIVVGRPVTDHHHTGKRGKGGSKKKQDKGDKAKKGINSLDPFSDLLNAAANNDSHHVQDDDDNDMFSLGNRMKRQTESQEVFQTEAAQGEDNGDPFADTGNNDASHNKNKKHKKHRKKHSNTNEDSSQNDLFSIANASPASPQANDPFSVPSTPPTSATDSNDPFRAPPAPTPSPDPFAPPPKAGRPNPFNEPSNTGSADPFASPVASDPFAANKTTNASNPFGSPSSNSNSTDPFGAPADPFGAPSNASVAKPKETPNSDPFAPSQPAKPAPSADPFSSPKPAQADPFAQPKGSPKPAAADPFSPSKPAAKPNADPFAAPSKQTPKAIPADPFAPAAKPVTDPFGQSKPAGKPAADPFSPSTGKPAAADPFSASPSKPVAAKPAAADPFATPNKPKNADPFTATKPVANDPFSVPKPVADPFATPVSNAANPFIAAQKPAADPFGVSKKNVDPFATPKKK